jgi:hypothetical protein
MRTEFEGRHHVIISSEAEGNLDSSNMIYTFMIPAVVFGSLVAIRRSGTSNGTAIATPAFLCFPILVWLLESGLGVHGKRFGIVGILRLWAFVVAFFIVAVVLG